MEKIPEWFLDNTDSKQTLKQQKAEGVLLPPTLPQATAAPCASALLHRHHTEEDLPTKREI